MDLDADLLGLLAASLSLGLCLAAWARRHVTPRRRHLRRMAGAAALLGAAALVLVD